MNQLKLWLFCLCCSVESLNESREHEIRNETPVKGCKQEKNQELKVVIRSTLKARNGAIAQGNEGKLVTVA